MGGLGGGCGVDAVGPLDPGFMSQGGYVVSLQADVTHTHGTTLPVPKTERALRVQPGSCLFVWFSS